MSYRAPLLALASLALLALPACSPARTIGGPPLPHEADRMSAEQAVAVVSRALTGVAEIDALRARIEAEGGRLVIMREGDADPSEDSPRVWQIFVGESRDTHLSRLWSFNVDAVTGAVTIIDPITFEEVPLDRWRAGLGDDPDLDDPAEPPAETGGATTGTG